MGTKTTTSSKKQLRRFFKRLFKKSKETNGASDSYSKFQCSREELRLDCLPEVDTENSAAVLIVTHKADDSDAGTDGVTLAAKEKKKSKRKSNKKNKKKNSGGKIKEEDRCTEQENVRKDEDISSHAEEGSHCHGSVAVPESDCSRDCQTISMEIHQIAETIEKSGLLLSGIDLDTVREGDGDVIDEMARDNKKNKAKKNKEKKKQQKMEKKERQKKKDKKEKKKAKIKATAEEKSKGMPDEEKPDGTLDKDAEDGHEQNRNTGKKKRKLSLKLSAKRSKSLEYAVLRDEPRSDEPARDSAIDGTHANGAKTTPGDVRPGDGGQTTEITPNPPLPRADSRSSTKSVCDRSVPGSVNNSFDGSETLSEVFVDARSSLIPEEEEGEEESNATGTPLLALLRRDRQGKIPRSRMSRRSHDKSVSLRDSIDSDSGISDGYHSPAVRSKKKRSIKVKLLNRNSKESPLPVVDPEPERPAPSPRLRIPIHNLDGRSIEILDASEWESDSGINQSLIQKNEVIPENPTAPPHTAKSHRRVSRKKHEILQEEDGPSCSTNTMAAAGVCIQDDQELQFQDPDEIFSEGCEKKPAGRMGARQVLVTA